MIYIYSNDNEKNNEDSWDACVYNSFILNTPHLLGQKDWYKQQGLNGNMPWLNNT